MYPQTGTQHRSMEMENCIKNCNDCHHICLETISYCLQKGGRHAEAQHIRLLMDCAQICHTSEDFMLRASDLHHLTCGVCAEVCERCAQDCESMASSDAQMKGCAEVCRRCAESCRQMAQYMQ
jgi:hypothetical protein